MQPSITKALSTSHPRLFLTDQATDRIKSFLKSDTLAAGYYRLLKETADHICTLATSERIITGRRLLDVSRIVLQRVTTLSLVYRIEQDSKYLHRAEEEMLAAASFEDWNPSHYLDTAEMTYALALGYDWLYHDLKPESREVIHAAIIEKGFGTYKPIDWHNNWNDVCNGSFVVAAHLLEKTDMQIASDTVTSAVEHLPLALHNYSPNGTNPEGPGAYWGYATSFSVPAILCLEQFGATAFNLEKDYTGYLRSGEFFMHMVGPSGRTFNYSDAIPTAITSSMPQLFWFAQRNNKPEIALNNFKKIRQFINNEETDINRFSAFNLIWWPQRTEITPTASLSYHTQGPNQPVASHRTAWNDPRALWVAIKGGSPSASHAHMDAGNFILEADGVRWALDLGLQDYHSLEKIGFELWPRHQESPRWTVFRLGNKGHNVPVVNDKLQDVCGNATLEDAGNGRTLINLTSIYSNELTSAYRGLWVREDKTVLIQDDVIAKNDRLAEIRWAMLTEAEISIDNDKAVLTQDGETMEMAIVSPQGAKFEIYQSDPPPADYDAPNPGTKMVGFKIKVAPGRPETIAVLFTPGSVKSKLSSQTMPRLIPLADWNKESGK